MDHIPLLHSIIGKLKHEEQIHKQFKSLLYQIKLGTTR